MKEKITLLPGTPNDDNRDYLPEAIKGSDMIVNENGNNSQVYPTRLKEYSDIVADGIQDTWFEYVPAIYDGKTKVPLVIPMHGGLMTGWGQAIYTSWTLVADREGFIVLFPSAGKRRMWTIETEEETLKEVTTPRADEIYLNVPPKNPDDNHDMNFVLALIGRMKRKYNIDEGRVFMQGMSMGNAMSSQFARYHGEVLAGKAGSGGPSSPRVLFDKKGSPVNRSGPLAVWQTRLELDAAPPHYQADVGTVVKRNREYWKLINKCTELPQIMIRGEDNFAFYTGELADYVFRDVKNRDHGQTLDDADLVWSYLFSGIRRDENGAIVRIEPNRPRTGDSHAIALADGKSKAYVNNRLVDVDGTVFCHRKLKYHGLNGGSIVRGEYFMVPVSFVAQVFGAKLTVSCGGQTAELALADGRELQFARGSIGCVLDNEVHSMLCEAVFRDGELYVPIEWVSQYVFNDRVSRCGDVLYITDHYAELSVNMASLIRDEILVK